MMDFSGYIIGWIWLSGLASILLAPFRKRTSNANIAPLVIPAAMLAIKGIASFFGNKSANEAKKAEMLMYNEWLKDRSQTADEIAGKLAERGIDIYGPQVSTQSSSGTSSSSTRSHQDSTTDTAPVITPEYQAMEAKMRALVEGRLGQGQYSNEEFVRQQLANRVRAINSSTAGAEQSILNRMGRQGGGALKTAGGLTPLAISRAGRIADVAGNVGAEARALEDATIAQGKGLTEAFGRGSTSHTVGDMFSNTTGQNNSFGTYTAPPNYSSLLSFLSAPAPTSSGKTGYNPYADAAGQGADLGLALWQMNQQGMFKTPTSYPKS